MNSLGWLAVQVAARQEFKVASRLRSFGYEEYVPAVDETRNWTDRTKRVSVPLFPGYAFCRIDPDNQLPPILHTPGVIRFVGLGNRPAPIDDSEMESVRIAVASGALVWRYPGLAKGERVELKCGPLKGCCGKIDALNDKTWSLVVSITLLHRSVAVEIDPAWVTLLKKPTASRPAEEARKVMLA